jgi:hypothetical protein
MRLNCKIGLPAAVRALDRAVGVVPPDPPVLHPNEIERLLAEQGGWRRCRCAGQGDHEPEQPAGQLDYLIGHLHGGPLLEPESRDSDVAARTVSRSRLRVTTFQSVSSCGSARSSPKLRPLTCSQLYDASD